MIDQRGHQPVYSPLSLRLRVQWRVGLLLAALLLLAPVAWADYAVDQVWEGDEFGEYVPYAGPESATESGACVAVTSVIEAWASGLSVSVTGFVGVVDGGGAERACVWGIDGVGDLQLATVVAVDEGPSEPTEVDLQEAGTWFASAFMVVVMLWGMGKGIGLIVSVLRGR